MISKKFASHSSQPGHIFIVLFGTGSLVLEQKSIFYPFLQNRFQIQ
ncbi:hypothetical protein SD77_0766 [Bacillus badius]|uniref:Uncharacterized protein n=1 Tax=Bacillus badius TaxID=1455 RepID=A0ABR5AU76_BACBA|nr:hypothetical protein SD77_0766 [Bacillus badius]